MMDNIGNTERDSEHDSEHIPLPTKTTKMTSVDSCEGVTQCESAVILALHMVVAL